MGAHGLKLRSFRHGVRSCFCPESVLQYTRNFIAMSPPLGSLGLSNRAAAFVSRPANIFQSDGCEENNERTARCLECKGSVFIGNEAQNVRVILHQIQSSLFFLELLKQRIESWSPTEISTCQSLPTGPCWLFRT